jgi:hypothetical protein
MSKFVPFLLFACLFCSFQTLAQVKVRGSVKGIVVDSAGKLQLSEATVSLTPEKDTANPEFVITDKHGGFLFRNLDPGKYLLLVTFEGFKHVARTIIINASAKDIDFGNLYLQKATDLLQEVIVQSPPMRIVKDTIEYNAASFATKPNALAEDQLKKLPGVQVDASGNITAQGEKVTRVLVNGKRFFGDDPKLATRNLPPDIVEKYQIFDDLDDQSKFSGFDDGNRVKTINIVTRRDRRQGYFGRAVVGAGTNQAYDESVNFHRFDNNRQLSLIGEGNDINKQNFTAQDILGSSGSRRGSGRGPAAATNGGGSGVTTVWAGGINYRDSLGRKGEIYGSYFYNFAHVATGTQSLTEKFFDAAEDTSNTTNRNSQGYQRSTNQRLNLNIEEKVDNNSSFIFRPNITFQSSKPNTSSSSATVDQNGNPISSSQDGTTSSANHGLNINGSNITFRHKFAKPYRTLSLDLNGTVNVNNGDGYSNSLNTFNLLDSTQNLRQFYNDSLHSVTLSPTLSYTEPISKNSIVELNYNHNYTHNTATNNTFDYDDATHGYGLYDSLFSNSYKFESNSDRVTLNYRIQNPKFNFSAGSGVQFTNYNSLNTTKNIDVSHNYVNWTPAVTFTYSFTHMQRIRFFYSGRTGQPSASQLQPLTTTNDNINYTVGNPGLKPQFTHSIRLLYNSYNPSTQNVLFATLNASTTVNDIQTAIVPNNKGGQTTMYVNLNGTYSLAGYFDYGWSLKNPKSNLNLITNINYSQAQTLVDSVVSQGFQHDYSRNTTLSETVSWTSNIKKNFDMNFSSTSSYNIGRNSLRPQQDLNTFSQVVNAEITAYTNSGWLIAATFTYTYTNTQTPGYNASIPLISPSIAKELFKKKNGEIRLSMFDLLHENTSVSKTVSLNRVAVTRTSTLQQYVMLSFTYNLNNFAKRGQRKMPGVFPPGGGRFRGGGGGGGGGFGGHRGG